MKRKGWMAAACCLLLLISTGCNNATSSGTSDNTANTSDKSTAKLTVSDYCPIKKDTKYVYQGNGSDSASYSIYNDYTSKNKVQQRIDNGSTVICQVLSLSDGQLTQVYSKKEAYYRENNLNETGKKEILLKEPIKKGTTWTLDDGSTRTITATSVPVNTSAKNYTAIEVTTKGTNGTTTSQSYYAKDVGLVKKTYSNNGAQITSTLDSIDKNVAVSQKIRLFYPKSDGTGMAYKDRSIDFRTNDVTKDILAKAYQDTPSGTEKVFTGDTAINSLTLKDDGIVYVDLNQAFLTHMNDSAKFEKQILQSIVNTFGHYYNAGKVIITIEGKAYSSKQISYSKDKYLLPDYKDAALLS